MKTLAAILEKTGKPLKMEELSIPELKQGQVLVKIKFTGLCRSQLNEISGLKGADRYLPHTLGHEGSGIVLQTGPAVTKVKSGDHVVLTWIKGRGLDGPGALYKAENGSTVNSGAISTFLTIAVISENRLVKIQPELPLLEASLLGCAVPTGAGIVFNNAQVKKNSTAAIFGLGGIGHAALLACKIAGASTIIAVDKMKMKLRQSLLSGATHIINTTEDDELKAIQSITGGQGVDYAIECSGVKTLMENAFKSVKDGGGLCIIAGNLPCGEEISINPFDLIKGKRITGTWGGETDPDRDIPYYGKLFAEGTLDLKTMISPLYDFYDINLALADLEQGKVLRAIVEMP